MYHRVDAVGRQPPVNQTADGVNPQAQPVGEGRPDHIEGQVEDQQHDPQKHRDSRILAGENLIHLHRAPVLLALVALHHGLFHRALNKAVAHVRQGGVSIQAGFRLHLQDAVLQQLLLVLVQAQHVRHIRVALNQLGGAEPGGDAQLLRVILNQMHHRVDAAVNRGAVIAEVVNPRQHPVFRHGHSLVDQLGDALSLGRHNRHHRHAQGPAQPLDVHRAAVVPHLVHHVQRHHRGDPQLQQLQGQIEISLNIGGVHNVDDAVRLLVQNEVPGDNLLLGVGPQGIDSRQIHHRAVPLSLYLAHLLVNGNPREVAHMLVGAGEGIEQGGLAAVLVSHQGKNHFPSTSGSISIFWASSIRSVSS